MRLLKIAHVPPATVGPEASVLEAVGVMARDHVGAVAIVENGSLLGIFTERDLMLRVAQKERSPRETRVREVMTSPVATTADETPPGEAMALMLERHLRHLPIVGADGKILGILSIRDLLQDKVEDLRRELHSIDQYLLNDGPGG